MRKLEQMEQELQLLKEELMRRCKDLEEYDTYLMRLSSRRAGFFGAQEALQEMLRRWEPLRGCGIAELLHRYLQLFEEYLRSVYGGETFARLQSLELAMQTESERAADINGYLRRQEANLEEMRQRAQELTARMRMARDDAVREEQRCIRLTEERQHLESRLDDLRKQREMEEARGQTLEKEAQDQRDQLERARYYAEHLEADVLNLRWKNEEELKSIQHKIEREERMIQDLANAIQSQKETLEARQQERLRLAQEWTDLHSQPKQEAETEAGVRISGIIGEKETREEELQNALLRNSLMHMLRERGAGSAGASDSSKDYVKAIVRRRTVPAPKTSKVSFSAVAPKKLVREEYSIIHVLMYEEDHRHIVDEVIAAEDAPVKETKSGVRPVEEGAKIRVVLSSKDIALEDTVEEGVWYGQYLQFQFPVMLPADYSRANVLFTAVVYINGVISTRMNFVAACSAPQRQQMEVLRRDVMSAFISYASEDRPRVAAVVQGIQKVRADMDIFFDITSLHSGDYWEDKLMPEIDKRDILYLCWSKAASASPWVDREWRYALEHKGLDGVEPIPIDKPKDCPPPEELKKKHFNDILLYIANG